MKRSSLVLVSAAAVTSLVIGLLWSQVTMAAKKHAAGPGLVVKSISNPPPLVAAGGPFSLRYRVENRGRGKSATSWISIFLSSNGKLDKSDPYLAAQKVKSLKAGKRFNGRASLTAPRNIGSGPLRVLACLDRQKKARLAKAAGTCLAAKGSIKVTTVKPLPADESQRPPGSSPQRALVVQLQGAGTGLVTGPGITCPGDCTETYANGAVVNLAAAPAAGSNFAGWSGGCANAGQCRLTMDADRSVGAHFNQNDDPIPPPQPGPDEAPAPGPVDPVPPAPASVAPPLDETDATSIGEATKFLYQGLDPIQTGVATGAIDATQTAAVLRGRVTDESDQPLSGVRVTVLDHPELGRTATRADGRYDIAVNGGGPVTLEFEREGFISSERLVEDVPWLDYAAVDDVAMVAYSTTSNEINLDSQAANLVAESSVSQDGDGSRKSTLIFDRGTEATMTMPDGSTEAVDQLTVRSTEYTVGANGLDAMPGQLPPTTAFTYAVELSIDQAVEEGATDVHFSKPVVNYVDNFLDFPAGIDVPTGYYDDEKGEWVGGPNGRVIKILSVAGGLAAVDVDGDGQADSGTKLTALGIDEDELRRLASSYGSGKSLWRVEVTHFTPWDYNFPYGPPPGAETPNNPAPEGDAPPESPCQVGGSIIDCESQVLGERLAVTGTGLTLNYRSNRVPGRLSAYTLDIPVSGSTVSPDLAEIDLQVEVAGRAIDFALPPTPNQVHHFVWDGLDAYGRAIQGSVPATVRIGYRYEAVYQQPADFEKSWSRFSGVAVAGDRARKTISFSQEYTTTLGTWDARGMGLGGWTLSAQQSYDPGGRVLYLGDGAQRSAEATPTNTLNRYAGSFFGFFGGDGGPALGAGLNEPGGLAAGPDGSLYIADTENDRIRRVAPDGTISTVAGNGTYGFAGDGGPATVAQLAAPEDVAVAADGSIYIADTKNNRIRRVAPDGKITTVAGGGHPGDGLGDDGPAGEARLAEPAGVAIGADGTLYIADQFHNRLRMVSPDGSITTAAGDGSYGASGDGGPALQARLKLPQDVTVADDGTVYIADTGNGLVRRIRLDGLIERVAGGGSPVDGIGDEGPALEASLGRPTALAFAGNGSLLIADRSMNRVRVVATDGTIVTEAGGGSQVQDGAPASDFFLSAPSAVATLPNGKIFIAEQGISEISVISGIFNGFGPGDVFIPSENGADVYQFDRNGRHLRTLDALTGAVKFAFAYDADGLLSSVTDQGGRITTVERDSGGVPLALVAPGGQRTALSVNGNGYLSRVENPAAEGIDMSYSSDGLLASIEDSQGGQSTFSYDSQGRLASDKDADGSVRTLVRQELDDGHRVTMTTGLGSTVTYLVQRLPGGKLRRTTKDRAGAATITTLGTDGGVTVDYPDGTRSEVELEPDPRFGMQAPVQRLRVEKTPGGLQRVTTENHSATLTEPDNPLTVEALTNHVSVNGRTSTTTYDGDTRTLVHESPEGRKSTSVLDEQGRLISVQTAQGLQPSTTTYDSEGRVAEIAQGSQSWVFGYDSRDLVATRTDATGKTISYEYDAADRLVKETLPSGRSYHYSYDENGERTSLTTPGDDVNTFTYTAAGLPHTYKPPESAQGYARSYDSEQKETALALPGGQQVKQTYDAGQRLAGIGFPQGNVSTAYVGSTDRPSSITRTPTGGGSPEGLAMTYDGSLAASVGFSGEAVGSFGFEYDDNFFVTSRKFVSGADSADVEVTRDQDGLPTTFGPFAIGRNGPAGAASSYVAGPLRTDLAYDTLGRTSGRDQISNGQHVYGEALTYGSNGKIATKTELSGGTSHNLEYGYDLDGQLTSVKRDGTEVERYTYDVNGNRTGRQINGGAVETATYDAKDRLTALNGMPYALDVDGFLNQRGADQFQYSARGELLSAVVGGTTVSYGYDGFGRRISRTVSGQETNYLYGNPSEPFQVTAVREPSGAVDQLFYDEKGLLIALERGGERYNVATDQVGTPHVVSDDSGAIVKALSFDAFGKPLSVSAPSFVLPIGFAGGINDEITGLVRFGLRDYDPAAGRFTARDPALFDGSPYNLYGYVGNDPLGMRDPSGLFCASFSAFDVIGGGVSLCIDSHGASACGKVGVGVGGGFSVDPFAGHSDTGISAYGEATVNAGPVSLGGSYTGSLTGCPKLDWSVGGGSGPLSVSYGSDGWGGAASGSFGDTSKAPKWAQGGPPLDLGHGVSAELSTGIEGCVGGDLW